MKGMEEHRMNLINKLHNLFGAKDDTPEIIEDMYLTRGASVLEIFHAEIGTISEERGISYFDAFVEYMDNSNIDLSSKKAVEIYLLGKGLCLPDVDQLVEGYFNA
jgi:hypothetical protein